MALRIGLHTGPQHCTYDELRSLWRQADNSGFYWISVWDHFYESPTRDGKGACFEAVSIMTALAAETRNVRVGCLVFCAGSRNPALLIKSAITIDHVSNGRLEFGLGFGPWEPEYRAFGYPYPPMKTRMDMVEEAAQISASMFKNEKTHFEGEHFTVSDAYCFPRPVQTPPRLWIAGVGEKRILKMVAKYADGWNVTYVSPEIFQAKSGVLDRWCEVEGRDPAPIRRSVNLGFYMGVDEPSAHRKREEFESFWRFGESGAFERADRDFDEEFTQLRGGMLLGTKNEVIDRMGEYVEAGVTDLNISMRAPFDLDAFQVFVEEVMPAFA